MRRRHRPRRLGHRTGRDEIGAGDAPPPADVGAPAELRAAADDQPLALDDAQPPAEPGPLAPRCDTPAAQRQIEALPPRLFLPGFQLEEQLDAVQMSGDIVVAERLRTARRRAEVQGEPPATSTAVTTVECVDDGAARVTVVIRTVDEVITRAGSVMVVDGAWRLTLDTFCAWNELAP